MGSSSVDGRKGLVGAYDGASEVINCVMAASIVLTVYNAFELIILIFMTFKAYKGLYFWSLLIATIGLIPYAVGNAIKLFDVGRWVGLAVLTVGWYLMVTGQAVVLWSRLHLVVSGERGDKILRFTLWMIIGNAIVLHLTTSVVTFGSNGSLDTMNFIRAYNVIEKLQMTGFCIQEIILSSIYIFETVGILKTSLREGTRNIMRQLLWINVIIIMMDLGLLGIEYASIFWLETVLKGVIYSIKLKIEFAILNRLVQFTTRASDATRTGSVDFVTSPLDCVRTVSTSVDPLSDQPIRSTQHLPSRGMSIQREMAAIEKDLLT